MKLVFDANILIDHLRGGAIWDQILKVIDEETELFLPSIVVMELFSGNSSGDTKVEQRILNLLKCFRILDLDEEIAQKAGEIYRDVNPNLDVPDYIVAVTALKLKAQVVTLNKKHFKHIPGVRLFEF